MDDADRDVRRREEWGEICDAMYKRVSECSPWAHIVVARRKTGFLRWKA